MAVRPSDYEELLARFSNRREAIALLKQHRPYLELLPSMRRPSESLIAIPLPLIRVDTALLSPDPLGMVGGQRGGAGAARPIAERPGRYPVQLPCDVALLMCDPEWKVKTGADVFVFVHRPEEDFYDLLGRWRRTQLLLDREYEWIMPLAYRHVMSECAERIYPLFVLFSETPPRIGRGLKGAHLPFVVHPTPSARDRDRDADADGEDQTATAPNPAIAPPTPSTPPYAPIPSGSRTDWMAQLDWDAIDPDRDLWS
jgi:hypothetical protein